MLKPYKRKTSCQLILSVCCAIISSMLRQSDPHCCPAETPQWQNGRPRKRVAIDFSTTKETTCSGKCWFPNPNQFIFTLWGLWWLSCQSVIWNAMKCHYIFCFDFTVYDIHVGFLCSAEKRITVSGKHAHALWALLHSLRWSSSK